MIAARHYLQTRDAHFDLAAGIEQSGAACSALCAQNAAQHQPASVRTDPHESSESLVDASVAREDAELCETLRNDPMGAAGFEPAKA
ncbi:MAG: hypothetical protein DYG93_04060 [Leptolyngbya sp. PLA2]|nr:hypothetical protein [Leptolyngbya sp. PL-A2]MCQ3939984.1 hypothetical protein [cyanobacterium CYA1]